MTRIHVVLLMILSQWLGLSMVSAAETIKPLKILRITPQGEDISLEQQIALTFNQPVVALGQMEQPLDQVPVTIEPALSCHWRWLNRRTLACQLKENTQLQPATRYQVVLRPGIQTASFKTLSAPVAHHFITQRPKVSYTDFESWRAPGMPVIQVHFNQPVTQASVEQHLYLQTEHAQKVAVMVQATAEPAKTAAETWSIAPKQLLPLATSVQLKIEPGLVSTKGAQTGVEKRVIVRFTTFPAFRFLGLQCFSITDKKIILQAHSQTTQRCDPLAPVALRFSSPVPIETLKEHLLILPELDASQTDPWAHLSRYSHLNQPHKAGELYEVRLPTYLKAYQRYQLKSSSAHFKDAFGRALPTAIDLSFATDHRQPKHVFEHQFSVLETGVDSEVPIYITNLKKLRLHYQLLTPTGWSKPQHKTLSLPAIEDIAFKTPLGIRALTTAEQSIVQGFFSTEPDFNNADAEKYNWFLSQITPFHVHAKLGHHNTLVWVTDFATGLPVADVHLTIHKATYGSLNTTQKTLLAQAHTNKNGLAQLPGTRTLDPKLQFIDVYQRKKPRLFIQAQKASAQALLPLDYEFKVHMYDVMADDYELYPHMRPRYGHIHTWGTTAQGIYKVGDTVQYKCLVRDQSNEGFVAAPTQYYHLKVIDPKGKTVKELKKITLSKFGGFSGELTIPKTAAVGWYRFQLSADFTEETWTPLKILVSDFTPAPFRVHSDLKQALYHQGDTVQLNVQASLHAGGPYTQAPTQITALIQQHAFEHQNPQTRGFQFDVYQEDVDEAPVHQSQAQLDQQGQLHSQFTLPSNSPVVYGQLLVETAVKDDRGKDVTERVKARYLGRDRFVGLKTEQWLFTAGQPAQVQLLVVDEHGQPVTDTPIHVEIEHLETQAARVKGAGNAYLTQYQHQWRAVDRCQLQGAQIPSSCGFVPPKAGDYKITAQVEDSYGQPHTTKLQQWAVGGDHVVWETSPGNGLTIQPEQQQYQVGDSARYVVKNPYPGAQALVTVERLGVLKSWVTTLKDSVAVVEVPVEADYVPGFFVSVMVMSPRVDKPINQQQVDLGKPAFRMGYVKTTVIEPYKQLKVKVKTDKAVYRPREQVSVKLQVYNHQQQVPKHTVELAISVLDEAVLDLLTQGRRYFDPYRGFYTLDRLDMANFSLLMRLVGRQKFEKKGANAGGDGGGSLGMRSLFKFVSYWNPSLMTDEQGQAQIQFQVPDNLTGWRILAMAVTPGEQMGLGEGHFKVNQPIEIRPVLPNHLIQGDSLEAGFNIMNRSEHLRQLEVLLAAQGPLELEPCPSTLTHCGQQQTLQATPFQRYNLWLPLKTQAAGVIEFKAQAHDDQVADQLQTTLTVHKRRSLMTAATYGSSTEAEIQELIQLPKAIHTDVGQVEVTVTPSLISGLKGAFDYMRDYPYSCWEQKLSKARMAAHYQNLQDYLPPSFEWGASQQLPADMLTQAAEYQAPNGGMAYYIADDRRVDPYLSAYTALLFNGLRSDGYTIPSTVENKLHDYLLQFLRQDVMPSFYAKGMAASVRAVALAALARHNKITRADLKRYQPHLQQMDLWGQAHFLQAALTVPQTEPLRQTVIENLLGHMEQTSGKVVFQEQLANRYKHILSSQLRTQCAILSGFMAYSGDLPAAVADIPLKLVRQISASRKSQGHWHNTQENVFCLQALTDYQRRYEQHPPQMTLHTWLDEAQLGSAELTQRAQAPQRFSRALTEADPGRQAQLKITREGQGRWYYTVRVQYAPTHEQTQAIDAGIQVKREYHVKRGAHWQLLNTPMQLNTGELVRVDLYVSVAGSRHFVVVDDPIPGGLEPVNRQLATASRIATVTPQAQDFATESYWHQHNNWQTFGSSFWNFYHKELRHQAARFYADYLPPGHYHLTYVAQVIAAGNFQVMPTHAEEMYDPEVYGKGLPAQLIVRRQM